MDDTHLWQTYSAEKRKIEDLNLSPQEYEKAIRELCKRLGI